MDYYFQINFTSGIGDFYTYLCEICNISISFKKQGHNTHLVVKSKRKIDFFNLFETDFYDLFDTIVYNEQGILCSNFNNYMVLYPGKTWQEGVHCWELIGEKIPETFDFIRFNLSYANSISFTKDSFAPKLSKSFLEKTNDFLSSTELKNFCVLHFRIYDDLADAMNSVVYNKSDEKVLTSMYFKISIDNIFSPFVFTKLDECLDKFDKVVICSNSVLVKSELKKRNNRIVVFQDDELKTLRRDFSDIDYFNQCILEFSLMSFAEKILVFSYYTWITNFISYGVLNHNYHDKVNPYHDKKLIESYSNFLVVLK